ncbi:hypothetical protein Q1695_015723 [Nippostrongylus brasiliensis]|nr:hypothetical protein Q1695_015723 [Nippostrongylus brasiliensis]
MFSTLSKTIFTPQLTLQIDPENRTDYLRLPIAAIRQKSEKQRTSGERRLEQDRTTENKICTIKIHLSYELHGHAEKRPPPKHSPQAASRSWFLTEGLRPKCEKSHNYAK